MKYDYPGNVRELENIIEQSFVLCQGVLIELEHLPSELQPKFLEEIDSCKNYLTLKDIEKFHITESLRRHAGNRNHAAKELGINASTLYRKIKALDIRTPSTDGRSKQR